MESTPGSLNNSEIKRHPKTGENAHRQLGRRALRPPYDDHEDAHSALGGGVLPHKIHEGAEKVYPTGLTETILFAGRQQRETVNPRYVEVIRAYDLSLDVLTSSQFHQLSFEDQMRVTVAGHDVIEATRHRADVLVIDGNFEHPSFQQYGFASQQEADRYAAELKILHHDLMTREAVLDIEQAYRALKGKNRHSKLAKLAKQTRDLTVSIEEDGEVVVARKSATG